MRKPLTVLLVVVLVLQSGLAVTADSGTKVNNTSLENHSKNVSWGSIQDWESADKKSVRRSGDSLILQPDIDDLGNLEMEQQGEALNPSSSGTDSHAAGMGEVVKTNGKYYSVYAGTTSSNNLKDWIPHLAVSENGLDWDKKGIIFSRPDGFEMAQPHDLYYDEVEGRWVLFFHAQKDGTDIDANDGWEIWYAHTEKMNASGWTVGGKVVDNNEVGLPKSITNPSVVQHNGSYYMYVAERVEAGRYDLHLLKSENLTDDYTDLGRIDYKRTSTTWADRPGNWDPNFFRTDDRFAIVTGGRDSNTDFNKYGFMWLNQTNGIFGNYSYSSSTYNISNDTIGGRSGVVVENGRLSIWSDSNEYGDVRYFTNSSIEHAESGAASLSIREFETYRSTANMSLEGNISENGGSVKAVIDVDRDDDGSYEAQDTIEYGDNEIADMGGTKRVKVELQVNSANNGTSPEIRDVRLAGLTKMNAIYLNQDDPIIHQYSSFSEDRISQYRGDVSAGQNISENLSVVAEPGAELTVSEFDLENETIAKFDVNQSSGDLVVTIQNTTPNQEYTVYQDGEEYKVVTSDGEGSLSFNKSSDWSEHTFRIVAGSDNTGILPSNSCTGISILNFCITPVFLRSLVLGLVIVGIGVFITLKRD